MRILVCCARRQIYIELPGRDRRAGGDEVGLLRKALYGTRGAPQLWAEEVQRVMTGLGFLERQIAAIGLLPQKAEHAGCCARGRFSSIREGGRLGWLAGELANTFDFSKVILENTSLDKHEAKYLDQIIRWTTGNKVEYEADPRHADILLQEWGLDQCRPNTVPLTKAMVDQLADGEELSEGEAKRVRRRIARINHMPQDRPDLSYSAREQSRHMAKPKDGTKKAQTYAIRYLQGSPRCVEVWAADCNPEDVAIKVLCDADWASDKVGMCALPSFSVRTPRRARGCC